MKRFSYEYDSSTKRFHRVQTISNVGMARALMSDQVASQKEGFLSSP